MADIKSLDKAIDLAARLGLFFAQADGKYTDDEKQFIERFIGRLSKAGDTTDVQQRLEAQLAADPTPSFEDILSETNSLLGEFGGLERILIRATLINFVRKVIAADSEVSSSEKEYFEKFQAQI